MGSGLWLAFTDFCSSPTLAVSGETTGAAFFTTISGALDRADLLARPELLLQTLDSMSFVLATSFLLTGAVCLIKGWQWHRVIVLLLALLGGIGLGHLMSLSMGRSMVIALSVGVLCAALAAPMLKWTVAILAGVVGAIVGINTWGILAPEHATEAWAGAAIGFIVLAMASFILSRLVITFFMSVSGGLLFVAGGLALLLRIETIHETVLEHLETAPMVVPLLVVVASCLGFILQRPAGAESDEDYEAAAA